MAALWHDVLYQPLLNALIALYQYAAGENLGLAVIELTLAIRVLLLPFSIVSERKQALIEEISRKYAGIQKTFANDSVKQRAEVRKLLRTHRVNPWAKVVVLGVQILVFVLLYQVFLGGMDTRKFDDLYSFLRRPDFVNTDFLGFDVAVQNVWWAVAVGVFLFAEIAVIQYQRRPLLHRRDVLYRYVFPIVSVLILMQLPMVKSIFVLTSMAFSVLLFGIRKGVT
jgi:YidC/Oxa1 family membrane protein insertase